MTGDKNDFAANRSRRSRWTLLVAGAVALGIGAGASACFRGHHGFAGHGHDPEAMRERIEFGVAWVAKELDATNEQEEQLQTILGDAADDVIELAEIHRGYREQWLTLMTSEEIDRDALQELRIAELAVADGISARVVDALADAADVLTPEQRVELREQVRKHHR